MFKLADSTFDRRQTVVSQDGACYLVSTIERPEYRLGFSRIRYETMVFPCDREGNVHSYLERYTEYYDTENEAINGHTFVCKGITDGEIIVPPPYSYEDEEDSDD